MRCLLLPLFAVFLCLMGAAQASPPVDTDGDGLPDFQEVHKYFTNPHRKDTAGQGIADGDWNQRREFTYSIASVLKVLKPCNPADMNDDYQDARVLAQDKDSYTLEVVYYPFNTNKAAIGENLNWKQDDVGMTEYLRPTPTENWDARMRVDLVTRLKAAGIDPDKLSDRQVVERVSRWAIGRCRTTDAFAIWDVYFPDGKAMVYPALRSKFDSYKPDKTTSDQQMFDQEVLGRSMFYNKVHGTCTSSAVYLTTIFRALGIPTRIVFCIPPVDMNDKAQVTKFLAGIHHHQARAILEAALTGEASGGFSNHLFNEVYVGHHWTRLNYDALGQNILDANYFGLLTHIYTCADLSRVPLAQTWGMRYAHYAADPAAGPKLSSVNPYMLLSVSDHFGAHSRIANPDVSVEELRAVTINGVYWKDSTALPPSLATALKSQPETLLLIEIKEWISGKSYLQLRQFARKAGRQFVLRADGQPDIKVSLQGGNFDNGNGQFQAFAATINAQDRARMVPGLPYKLVPLNTSDVYKWTASDKAVLIR